MSLQKLSNSSVEIVSKTSLLTQVPDYYNVVNYRERLEFVDCPMLDPRNITTEFQTRALRLGTAVLAIQKQTKVKQVHHFFFFFYYGKLPCVYYLEQ